jgi:tight adherence protein C
MLYFAVGLIGLAVSLLVVFLAQVAPTRPAGLTRQLDDLRRAAGTIGRGQESRLRSEELAALLQKFGERVSGHRRDQASVKLWLAQAGFLGFAAVPVYWGCRFGLTLAMGTAGFLMAPLFATSVTGMAMAALWAGTVGWVIPPFYIRSRRKARQKSIQRALPDALDMLVVCVEAGLGLNQALVRVAEEIHQVCPLLSDHLVMVNLEIRAGTAREQALRNLAERTGLDDVSSLVAMLIQTDRFGTSIANALRVQATSLRTKRRQRAEEAAAKTAIKLVFPLVLFIFPALFVVILAPAVMMILQALSTM